MTCRREERQLMQKQEWVGKRRVCRGQGHFSARPVNKLPT